MKFRSKQSSQASRYGWLPLLIFMMVTMSICMVVVPNTQTVFAQCGDPCLGAANPFSTADTGPAPVCSPIVIDVSGEGFQLSSAENGVIFDIKATGTPLKISWTAQGSKNAFLVLDRNGNGSIDNGKEMFGNFTDQTASQEPNGFLALAEFDKPARGGNGDGVINAEDSIFSNLQLWVDVNHDGISQPGELFKLPDLGVFSISLKYKESRRLDQFGNWFRFRSKINVTGHQSELSDAGPVAYDVFLISSSTR